MDHISSPESQITDDVAREIFIRARQFEKLALRQTSRQFRRVAGDTVKHPMFQSLTFAAEYPGLNLLHWLKSINYCWNTTSRNVAIAFGRLDILQWAYDNGHLQNDWRRETTLVDLAAGYGNINILRWARHKHMWAYAQTYQRAVRCGHLHVVKWLSSRQYIMASDLRQYAAACNQQEIAKWLERRCWQY